MKIYNYIPAFCDFDPQPFEFTTKEELLAYDWLKHIEKENGGIICFDYEEGQSYLMAVYPDDKKKDGCTWWVLSIIHDTEIAEVLKKWFPDYTEIVNIFKNGQD